MLIICKINSLVYQKLEITYSSRARERVTTGADGRISDEAGTTGRTTYCVAYYIQINPIQNCNVTVNCKVNAVVSLL
jgi:hypothetical protein